MATYDIATFQQTASGKPYVATMVTATVPGRKITGLEKLAQRFTLELLTEKGSIPFDPKRGTEFGSMVSGNLLVNEFDLFRAFGIALLTVYENLTSEETDDDPDDERFKGAVVNHIGINQDHIVAKVQVTNLANQVTNVTFPIVIQANQQVLATKLD